MFDSRGVLAVPAVDFLALPRREELNGALFGSVSYLRLGLLVPFCDHGLDYANYFVVSTSTTYL